MQCANVTVLSDGLVECEEDFTVELTLSTTGGGIQLGNNSTSVILIDSDGMHIIIMLKSFILPVNSL